MRNILVLSSLVLFGITQGAPVSAESDLSREERLFGAYSRSIPAWSNAQIASELSQTLTVVLTSCTLSGALVVGDTVLETVPVVAAFPKMAVGTRSSDCAAFYGRAYESGLEFSAVMSAVMGPLATLLGTAIGGARDLVLLGVNGEIDESFAANSLKNFPLAYCTTAMLFQHSFRGDGACHLAAGKSLLLMQEIQRRSVAP